MMVVDASAAYELLTEQRTLKKIAGAAELLAPDLIVPELLNARRRMAQARKASPDVSVIIEFLRRIRLLPALEYAADAAALAERLDHPVYDCLYVAIAQREHAPLLTLDQRLIKKLRSARMSKLLR